MSTVNVWKNWRCTLIFHWCVVGILPASGSQCVTPPSRHEVGSIAASTVVPGYPASQLNADVWASGFEMLFVPPNPRENGTDENPLNTFAPQKIPYPARNDVRSV